MISEEQMILKIVPKLRGFVGKNYLLNVWCGGTMAM
jgi:hypothetical protein